MDIKEILAFVPEDKRKDAEKTLEEHGAVNAEKAQKFLDGSEGKKILQPVVDAAVTKAIKTYEKNFTEEKLPGIIDAEVQKRHPEQTPEQKRIAALEAENRKIKEDAIRSAQIAKAQKLLADAKLPADLADRYAGLTDDETAANIGNVSKILKDLVSGAVKAKDDEWLAKAGRPGGGDPNDNKNSMKRSEFEALPGDKKIELAKQGIKLTD